ncbi:hypothetical protein F53441_12031 [Fusarium austroafricanum]|uniref:Negative regulator of differentiation 1 n=1 Tax=Fusarium austroafricanum TaxID=2364996 RepID=A0A8H4K2H1_9HYPO|nr:hypothetical protein F53441_12031 [Fusarium austroafricanum]
MNLTQNQVGTEPPINESQCVYIPQEEYESLVAVAHQYGVFLTLAGLVYLRQSLMGQGIDEATINSLCLPTPAQEAPSYVREHFGLSSPAKYPYNVHASPCQIHSGATLGHLDEKQGLHSEKNRYLGSSINQKPRGSIQDDKRSESNRWLDRSAQRSVLLLNLAPGVTHGDVAAVVRGGQLLEIFLRNKDNSATVSFVHEADACAFLDHSRAHGLYIKERKIHTKWSDYQFIMSGQVAHQVHRGGSRNFVIRKRDPNLTSQSIRDDLEHIHGLHVIDIQFDKDRCYISTNSIHAAIYARTCLQSRVPSGGANLVTFREYKTSRIEWCADECAQPLQSLASETRSLVPESKEKRDPVTALPSRKNLMGNRFQLLELSDTEGSNGDDSSDDSM